MSNAQIAAIDFQVYLAKRSVLQATIRAKKLHRIDVSQDLSDLGSMKYTGDTLVARVELVGWSRQPMYDQYPDLATFIVRTLRHYDIGLQSMERAKQLLDAGFLMDIWHDGFIWNREGSTKDLIETIKELDTNVDGVRLLDNLGNVVAEGTIFTWEQARDSGEWKCNTSVTWKEVDFAVLSRRESMLAEAGSLEAEASFESGWDNFDTARSLRAKADAIRRSIQIAENVTRLAA
jgi:hypothetical protein